MESQIVLLGRPLAIQKYNYRILAIFHWLAYHLFSYLKFEVIQADDVL